MGKLWRNTKNFFLETKIASVSLTFPWNFLDWDDANAGLSTTIESRSIVLITPASDIRTTFLTNKNQYSTLKTTAFFSFAWGVSVIVIVVRILTHETSAYDISPCLRIGSTGIKYKVFALE